MKPNDLDFIENTFISAWIDVGKEIETRRILVQEGYPSGTSSDELTNQWVKSWTAAKLHWSVRWEVTLLGPDTASLELR